MKYSFKIYLSVRGCIILSNNTSFFKKIRDYFIYSTSKRSKIFHTILWKCSKHPPILLTLHSGCRFLEEILILKIKGVSCSILQITIYQWWEADDTNWNSSKDTLALGEKNLIQLSSKYGIAVLIRESISMNHPAAIAFTHLSHFSINLLFGPSWSLSAAWSRYNELLCCEFPLLLP